MAADNIFKGILIKEKFCIFIWIPLTFVPIGPIDNKPALVEVIAWRRTGNKPLPGVISHQCEYKQTSEKWNMDNYH